jgi:hypothetical protein
LIIVYINYKRLFLFPILYFIIFWICILTKKKKKKIFADLYQAQFNLGLTTLALSSMKLRCPPGLKKLNPSSIYQKMTLFSIYQKTKEIFYLPKNLACLPFVKICYSSPFVNTVVNKLIIHLQKIEVFQFGLCSTPT